MIRPLTRLALLLPLAPLAALAACSSLHGAEAPFDELRQHEVTLRYSRTHLDDDFRPFDKGVGGALEYSYGLPRSPWRFFLGLSETADDVRFDQTFTTGGGAMFDAPVRFQAQIREIYAGVRHEWTLARGWVKPYFGGGASFAEGSIESTPPPAFIDPGDPNNSIFPPSEVDDDDDSFGLFTTAGVAFPLGDGFRVSADWRWLFLPEFDLFGTNRDGGYQLLGFSFGWRF